MIFCVLSLGNVRQGKKMALKKGPHFIGMGAQKAATSWLFKMLSMHPDVYFPRGKEVAYWNAPFDKKAHIRTYLEAFREGTAAAFGGVNGDITPLYMIIPEEDIRFLHETLPDVKLLFVARNPVERAISGSDFHMRFHADKVSSYDNLLVSPFITKCGLYMTYLKNWMKYFPRNQLHIIIQDDIKSDPRGIMLQVAEYLDIDPSIWKDIPEKYLRQQANSASKKTEISFEQRNALKKIYREDVRQFSQFIGRDLMHWVN